MIPLITFAIETFFIPSTFAGYGIITTLDAPIVRSLDVDAPTVMTARKGEKIYIHDKYFKNGPNDVVYIKEDKNPNFGALETEEGYEKFYETLDKNGQKAYISRYYVKLITNDKREFTQNITPFKPDPNDYRMSEPLPKDYPFQSPDMGRARISFSMGPDLKSNYNYNSVLTEEDFSNRYGLELAFGRKANWDKENRFYFGGVFQAWTSQARFTLFDDRKTTESRSQLSLGPYLSYDPYRIKGLRLTLETSIMVTYTRNLVEQMDITGFSEQRIFSGFGLSPRFTSFFQWDAFAQSARIITGFDIQLYVPQTLTSSTEPTSDLWNEFQDETDSVAIPFTAHWSLFFGIQTNF